MSESKQLILLDGSSFLYRAYFASRQNFTTKDGFATGAVYLLTRMLRNLVVDYPNIKIIGVFDAKGSSFRNEMFPEYKATRPPMPDDLRNQIEPANTLVRALGIPLISVPGVEADDVLGSYALEGVKQGYKVLICTSDKDLAQLVNEHIELLDTMKDVRYTSEEVFEKYGVPPTLIIDFLALKGDSADNIPGMKGVGDKTAIAVLNALGGIYDIRKNLDLVETLSFRGAGTFKKRFLEQWDQIELSYKLATIKTDVPLPIAIDDIELPHDDHDTLIELFDRLEFHRFATNQRKRQEEELKAAKAGLNLDAAASDSSSTSSAEQATAESKAEAVSAPTANSVSTESSSTSQSQDDEDLDSILTPQVFKASNGASNEVDEPIINEPNHRENVNDYKSSYKVIGTRDELKDLASKLEKADFFSFDVTTNGAQPSDAVIVGMSFCCSNNEAYYVPLKHNYILAPAQLSLDDIKEFIGHLLTDEKHKKAAWNSKEARLCLYFAGVDVKGMLPDSVIMAHIINSAYKTDMRIMAEHYLKYTSLEFSSIRDKKAGGIAAIDIGVYKDFACQSAHLTYRLFPLIKNELDTYENGKELCDFECEVNEVLYLMERCGAYLDGDELNRQARTLKESLYLVEQDIYELAGAPFNINSPKQLGRVLFEDLNIPYPRKTVNLGKDGKRSYSTADEILNELAGDFDIIGKIQRFRALSKLVSSYADKLPLLISRRTGRIHTVFNLAGTVTGRLTSSEPNLQNIPSRTKEGRQIRTAFKAPEGYKIVSADYSQIELRLIAHFSEDPGLIKAFQSNVDIHSFTAAEVLGKSIDEVTDEERMHAKATNFGLMYGMSAHGLGKQTGMSSKEAKKYITEYFSRYPRIKELMDSIITFAKEHGYTETISGFRIVIPGIQGAGISLRASERAAINSPMQGSAADIIKKAMVEVQNYINTLDEGAVNFTLQVHDELVFEVRDDLVETFTTEIKKIMENVYQLKVPLKVGIGVGESWAEAH